jgi:pyruvate kinase
MSTDAQRTGVAMDVHVGDRVRIDGGRITLVVEQKSGQKARIRIVAPRDVSIEWPKRIPASVG